MTEGEAEREEGGIEKELLEELARLRDALGVPPRTVDMGRHGRFDPALYADRFGSWEEALVGAGIDGEPQRPPDGAINGGFGEVKEGYESGDGDEPDDGEDGAEVEPSDESLRAIRNCHESIEGTPTPDDLRGRGYSVNAVLDEYGTWTDALEAAGVDTEYIDTSPDAERRGRGGNGSLLDEVRRYVSLHDERPSAEDVRAAEWMASPKEYRDAFGGVEGAVKEAVGDEEGVDEGRKDELVSEVRRYYLREGDIPDPDDVRATGWMSSVEAYREAFGGVRDAVEESGVD
jgi:hypothetical protein